MHQLNVTIISIKSGFHLSPHTASKNTKEENCYETFHTFKISLGPLNIVKSVNKSDFKISK